MKAQLLAAIAAALLLTGNIAGAQEQAPGQTMPGQNMMGQGMMGQGMGMMGQGMMGRGMGMMGHGMMGHGQGLRIMMILIDTDGDGALSLEEVQAAHAKIFKAVDVNKDGKVTLEEIQTFFRGGASPSGQ